MSLSFRPPGDVGKRTVSKVFRRLVPFLMALYVVNILDRVNLGYVALDMRDELVISAAAYGSLAAAFFIGYFFFEVPSNMLLERFGANKVMARIMMSWGIVTIVTFFVQNYWQLYVLRLLLGIMEAGFFPGIVFYLSQWFPAKQRGRAVTYFFVGSQIGTMLSAPLATLVIDHVSWFGMAGWRWVFMVEGIPAVALGIVAYFYLTNKPQDAAWLSAEERTWLVGKLETERRVNKPVNRGGLSAFRSLRVWHLAAIYLLFQAATQGMAFWAPTVVKGFSATFSNTTVGLILMIPPALSIMVMMIWGRHSDLAGERKYHALLPLVAAMAGIALAASTDSVVVKIAGIILYGASYPAFFGIFWTLPSVFLSGAQAAVGIAIINTTSSASTFGANTALGYTSRAFGNAGVLALIGSCLLLSALFLWRLNVRDAMLAADPGKAATSEDISRAASETVKTE